MRHNVLKNRFGRTTSHRINMMRNMVTNLLKHERMETTIPKAREVKRHTEKIITKAKNVMADTIAKAKGDEKVKLTAQRLHNIRLAGETVQDKEVLHKLFEELGPRYANRNGGYTRVMRLGSRLGDGSEVGIIELVDRPEAEERKAKDAARKASKEGREKKERSTNRPKKEAAPKQKRGQDQGPHKPQGPQKKGGHDASRGRGGSRGN
jgi:large subunit ribosomal protein L17